MLEGTKTTHRGKIGGISTLVRGKCNIVMYCKVIEIGYQEQKMANVTRIKAGQYSVGDGRFIVKNSSGWLIIDANGAHDFGPVPTLAAAKQYVESGTVPLGQHNYSTRHGRRQSKKEFNAYLASEAKNGNLIPVILWGIFLCIICGIVLAVRGY
ncbi:hypothetical protein ACWKM5_004157 [Cronobacter turicensis]